MTDPRPDDPAPDRGPDPALDADPDLEPRTAAEADVLDAIEALLAPERPVSPANESDAPPPG